MAKWTDYTIDTNPTDTDEVMTLDADKSPKANKRVTLSTLADYFLDKLASKVFAKLETQNKTVIGALNELNSKALTMVNEKYYTQYTDFRDIKDGIYSFNVNSTETAPEEYKNPPRDIGDGIIIIKTYATYQTMCCIGFKGIAVAQKDTRTNTFASNWAILATR